MSFRAQSEHNSNNKTNNIVGASVEVSSGVHSVKKNEFRTSEASSRYSSMAPSDEFKSFWGNNVENAWFEGKKRISPFLIFVFILILLNLYLCTRLIFAPGEIQQLLSGQSQADVVDASKISNISSYDDEKAINLSTYETRTSTEKSENEDSSSENSSRKKKSNSRDEDADETLNDNEDTMSTADRADRNESNESNSSSTRRRRAR
jgi:hypothetical protein